MTQAVGLSIITNLKPVQLGGAPPVTILSGELSLLHVELDNLWYFSHVYSLKQPANRQHITTEMSRIRLEILAIGRKLACAQPETEKVHGLYLTLWKHLKQFNAEYRERFSKFLQEENMVNFSRAVMDYTKALEGRPITYQIRRDFIRLIKQMDNLYDVRNTTLTTSEIFFKAAGLLLASSPSSTIVPYQGYRQVLETSGAITAEILSKVAALKESC